MGLRSNGVSLMSWLVLLHSRDIAALGMVVANLNILPSRQTERHVTSFSSSSLTFFHSMLITLLLVFVTAKSVASFSKHP